MAPKGQFLGFDIDDAAYVPVANALKLFNLGELNEIDIVYAHAGLAPQVEREVRRVMTERHGGEEDFTVTTQAAMLSVFDIVMNMITLSVGAIASISLLVGAIGILTMRGPGRGSQRGDEAALRFTARTAGGAAGSDRGAAGGVTGRGTIASIHPLLPHVIQSIIKPPLLRGYTPTCILPPCLIRYWSGLGPPSRICWTFLQKLGGLPATSCAESSVV
jgi:putative ABC transport system permease protein